MWLFHWFHSPFFCNDLKSFEFFPIFDHKVEGRLLILANDPQLRTIQLRGKL